MRGPWGTIKTPYWEWWLHHNPFRRYCEDQRTCPICESDTGCFSSCPRAEIENKLIEIVALMDKWNGRDRT